jgi:nitronate monooxygenase
MPLNDHRLRLRRHELVPLVIGGMGVNISTAELALEAARLGGVGHISDAGIEAVADMRFGTKFVRRKFDRNRAHLGQRDKSAVTFELDTVVEAQGLHVARTMEAKRGDGLIFINCMERLTMNDPRGTLRARLAGAMDAGIDGITLSAGLHLKSLALVQDHPRFNDVYFGIIVSSLRALKLFLRGANRVGRMPDYIVVEGPLAGGHLAFGPDDWHEFDLATIVSEIAAYLQAEGLEIPLVPAGGIFTGSDAVAFLESGAAAVQVATRFTITEESGLPTHVKQEYLRAREDDIVVNTMSSSGYPMRMLKQSPCLHHSAKPQCEALGYVLDANGECSYLSAYHEAREAHNGGGGAPRVDGKMCLCNEMRSFNVWTCGHNAYRLKDTAERIDGGVYRLPTAEEVFLDYLHG